MADINEYFMNKWYYDNIYKKHQHKQSLLWIDDLRDIPNNYIGEYNVKIAKTEEERLKGLQEVTELAKDEGMLFIYEKPQTVGF